MIRQVHNIKELKANRKLLRNNMTQAEAALWKMIRNSQLDGKKFRRQHSVDRYILDFYCPSEKLAIELDGADHYTVNGMEQDQERTAYLTTQEIRVIRFENNIVFEQPEKVLAEIKSHFGNPNARI